MIIIFSPDRQLGLGLQQKTTQTSNQPCKEPPRPLHRRWPEGVPDDTGLGRELAVCDSPWCPAWEVNFWNTRWPFHRASRQGQRHRDAHFIELLTCALSEQLLKQNKNHESSPPWGRRGHECEPVHNTGVTPHSGGTCGCKPGPTDTSAFLLPQGACQK